MKQTNDKFKIAQFMRDNSAYKTIFCSIIEFCHTQQKEETVLGFCDAQHSSETQIQSSQSILSMLTNQGALTQSVLVNGESYEGSLEELREDDSLPLDAKIETNLQATEEGTAAIALLCDESSFEVLLASCPERLLAFIVVLSACAETLGETTNELQAILKEKNLLEPDEKTGLENLHASYFTGSLESVSALHWSNKRWVTSPTGLAILAKQNL